jgi:CBS-domain-containing membrane protein
MPTLPGRLGCLTARDVMTRDVITLSVSTTVDAAIAWLREQQVTGAPVVDGDGRLVGVLSVRDLLNVRRGAQKERKPVPLAHGHDQTTWDLFAQATPLDSKLRAQTVSERMSRTVTSVASDAPIVEIARAMCDGHWHRVPVVDDKNMLCGIVSTMDILAAVVNAADEPD